MRKKILSITKKDFIIQTFRSGGKGGQHQNKTDSGVRLIHKNSGARGESRNHKSQLQNKKEALKRLTQTKEFKMWVARKAEEHRIGMTLEEEVNRMMNKKKDFKVEVKENGRWVNF